MRQKNGFEGWYFKHQRGEDTVAFIPGIAKNGAFIQMLCATGSRQFDVPSLSVENRMIKAGDCTFSDRGCQLNLPGVRGQISYIQPTPLKSDIMGPFRHLPMQCRHGVISMRHTLRGSITIDGQLHTFDGGCGYIEKDSGRSFPRSYTWLQCNDFPEPCSLMVSIAHIPFAGLHFTGCICAIVYKGREYRLATYHGVRIRTATADHICLSQGDLVLDIRIRPADNGFVLRSPVRGRMSGVIRESSNAAIDVSLSERNHPIFRLRSRHAMYEYVPETTSLL